MSVSFFSGGQLVEHRLALLEFALRTMDSRPPDVVIGRADLATPYMNRWHLLRNAHEKGEHGRNLYINQFMRSDNEVAHDHPWENTTFLLKGEYEEWTPNGSFMRCPGDVVSRPATAIHAIRNVDPGTISLFSTGIWERPWGFWEDNKWIPWRVFNANRGQ